MASTPWRSPASVVNNTSVGSTVWYNDYDPLGESGNPSLTATRLQSADGGYAETYFSGSGVTSNILLCTQFGFTSDIPAGSSIDGYETRVTRFRNGGRAVANTYWRPVVGGALVGTAQAVAGDWPSSIAAATFGGATALGGATPSQAQVIASTFGVGIHAVGTTGGIEAAPMDHTLFVDLVEMRVHYTEGGAVISRRRVLPMMSM